MPMAYEATAIADSEVPRASEPQWQHVLDTYASEINKVYTVWLDFQSSDLSFRSHEKSSSVAEILKHQLLSERRFFGEFLGTPEPPADQVLPAQVDAESCAKRLVELGRGRLDFLAAQSTEWWLETVKFFDVERERIWVFWRRVLHTAHHRTQLTVYARLMDMKVQPTYGPTADVTWSGADPTLTVDAAARK